MMLKQYTDYFYKTDRDLHSSMDTECITRLSTTRSVKEAYIIVRDGYRSAANKLSERYLSFTTRYTKSSTASGSRFGINN
jgi:hypothetical protein